jgi:anti-anti-sigma factor
MEFAPSLRVTVQGNIDNQTAKDLARHLKDAATMPWGKYERANAQETLVLDLSQVEFINSMGIGALLQCRQAIEERGRRLLVLIHPALADVFEIANLHTLFQIMTSYRGITGQIRKGP